jgi:hypothetical protein
MRNHGVLVPRKMTGRAREYVARKIDQATKRGAVRIDGGAARFAGKVMRMPRPQTIKVTLPPEHLKRVDAYRDHIRRNRIVEPKNPSRAEAILEMLELAGL